MSNVTLETLRADFKAARMAVYLDLRAYSSAENVWGKLYSLPALLMLRFGSPKFVRTALGRPRDDADSALFKSAHLYELARDHGLNAAMLYKLSDGNIDPRGAA